MTIDITPARTASLSERVAEEIRALLARRRTRQSQLARELGVSEQWISVRLRGVQPIDLNDLDRIAKALHVSVIELLPRPAVIANPPTGHTDQGGPDRHEPSVRKTTVTARSDRPAYPDHVRPRDTRPVGHPAFPVLPPNLSRPARVRRAT